MTRGIVTKIALAAALIIFATCIGIWLWLNTTLPDYSKNIISEDATAPIQIERDETGIPHITAQNFADAALGMGYAQAQDRFWQMEMMRRAAHGETAQVIGEAFVYEDLRNRALAKLPEMLKKTHSRLDDDTREIFDAFAAGVNLAIAKGEATSSPEWALLNIEPKPWTAEDVSVFAANTLRLLTDGSREMSEQIQEKTFSREIVDFLHAPAPAAFPTLYADLEEFPTQTGGRFDIDDRKNGIGTNFFIVGPDRSETGKPILAVDPHLPAYGPGVVYPVIITLPGDVIAGGAWIGTPAIAFGHNSRIAWGMTHLYADIEDYIVERIDPANPENYLSPEGSVPFDTRKVTIPVKGGEPRTFTVRETSRGVVVSDPGLFKDGKTTGTLAQLEDVYGPGHVVVRRQVNAEVGILTLQSIVNVSRSRNWDEFREALRDFETTNNLAYADVDGNIGVQMAARLPDRKIINGWNGRRPARGWLGEGQWNGYIPFDSLPYVYNPPKGWIADSNSRAVGDDFPFRISDVYSPAWRVRRSYDLLSATNKHSLNSIADIQLDLFSGQAEWLVTALSNFEPTSAVGKEAFEHLRRWDFQMRAEQPEPLIYAAFELALQQRLINVHGKAAAERSADVILISRILESDHVWCDHPDTVDIETCDEATNDAIDLAMDRLMTELGDDISTWRWGDAHEVVLPAYFSWAHLPLFGGITEARAPVGGGPGVLNTASSYRPDTPHDDLLKGLDFIADHAATYRMIADLSDLKNSRHMIASGVSGNAYSRYWNSFFEKWVNGDYVPFYGRTPKQTMVTEISPIAQ
ncbi:MAG: penicillin acylase family protein [Pseudomonadota bacterium]